MPEVLLVGGWWSIVPCRCSRAEPPPAVEIPFECEDGRGGTRSCWLPSCQLAWGLLADPWRERAEASSACVCVSESALGEVSPGA